LASDPLIHIFNFARSYVCEIKQTKVLFAGFPYHRNNVRSHFHGLLDGTGWREHEAGIKLLCLHHCFEGARVGPADYTFRYNDDVIRVADVPDDFTAVLSGHIHRHQILTTNLEGEPVRVPIIYSGSTERTSFAEKDEQKGYIILENDTGDRGNTVRLKIQFYPLRNRPMIAIKLKVTGMATAEIDRLLRIRFDSLHRDTVLKVEIDGYVSDSQKRILNINYLRSILPETITVDLRYKDNSVFRRKSDEVNRLA